jgi:type II secretory pathway component PulF
VPFEDALKAVAAELAPEPARLDELRRTGMDLDALRDRVDWTPGRVPPPGTLARELYAAFSALAIALGEGAPLPAALEQAAGLPLREGLRDVLRAMAAAGGMADILPTRPEFFAPSVVVLLRRTEQAGDLHAAFLVLADGVMSGCFVPRGAE